MSSISDVKQAQRFIGFNTDERPKGDFYPSPPVAVHALFDRETFGPHVWEPACGKGDIAGIAIQRGYAVTATDLYDWGYGIPGENFLELNMDVDAVITNPPFNVPKGISHDFAVHALKQTKAKAGKVAFLQRLQWLESKARKHLFTDEPFSKLIVFSSRLPRMHRYDFTGDGNSSMMAFGWYIWDWKHEGPPTIEWI